MPAGRVSLKIDGAWSGRREPLPSDSRMSLAHAEGWNLTSRDQRPLYLEQPCFHDPDYD